MNQRELVHEWAHFGADHGRASALYFEKERLYSYGQHYLLGKLFTSSDRGDIALINSQGYSSTTAKHTSYAVGALKSSRWQIIFVPCPEAQSKEDHDANIQHLIGQQQEAIKKLKKSRTRLDWVLEDTQDNLIEYEAYTRFFRIKRVKFPTISEKQRQQLEERARFYKQQAESKEELRRARRAALQAEALEAWRRHENDQTFWSSPVALRLSKDAEFVETTKGARVPVRLALKLFRDWQAGKDITGQKIGSFEIDSATAEGVEIGCHIITASEINKFFTGIEK